VHEESPDDFYEEHEVVTLGTSIPFPEPTKEFHAQRANPGITPYHIDLDLDPVEIKKLLPVTRPTIELKSVLPVKKKKAGKSTGLRGWGA
jgi:hypothetical protein